MSTKHDIWTALLAAGLTPAGAAGVMGNLKAESALDPRGLQNSYERSLGFTDDAYTRAVDAGTYRDFAQDRAGYGLAQWTHPARKRSLLEFAQATGRSIGDAGMQTEFLIAELQNYPLWGFLRKTQDAAAAAERVMLEYERPADTSPAARAYRAGLALDLFAELCAVHPEVPTYTDTPADPEPPADPAPAADTPSDPVPAASGKSAAAVAQEVLTGIWGNGAERKMRLTAAGYDYAAVQTEVNRILHEAKRRTHRVAPGDTLTALARRYGTTVWQIVQDNRERYPSITANHIVAGWELAV
ncbi:MAG: LysM peptidoglycan-binding domain-containing protein [Oscillospiraceae bacterium]|nr:LysM peptidoglycan-binding domain-containing protein [Oscillospiraceae bacterium]